MHKNRCHGEWEGNEKEGRDESFFSFVRFSLRHLERNFISFFQEVISFSFTHSALYIGVRRFV